MLFGIMPYLMELEIKKLKAELDEKDNRIKSLEKIVEYDVEEITELKRRVVALGGDPDVGIRARLLAQTAMPDRNNRPRKRLV